ncbi:hypothetical protein DFP72DRAFT_1047880 [Ephemerocybe angulata]|uniref:MYND-type domain-containing protein n=1 Tax=Ephemerocybe angulata TaxID=980116 RepID=A0A8H6M2Z3_9AGAR|nr:hypothetical protein DFP72DRAFT_1047880 [Tulosesus angulatus]
MSGSMSARALFDLGQVAMGGVAWWKCQEHYVKAMKKILEDDKEDLAQTYFKVQPEGELETMPNELLAMAFRDITALFLEPTKFFTPGTSVEAYTLIVRLSAPNYAEFYPRLANASTFRERLLRKSLQIHATMTLANIGWDSGNPTAGTRHFTKAIALYREEKGLFNPKPSPGLELWISTGLRAMRDKIAFVMKPSPNLRDICDGEVKRGVTSGKVDIKKEHGLLGNADGCSRCKTQDVKLSRCSRCRVTSYCGAVCQKADWK